MEQYTLACQVARFGEVNRSAEAMLAAASMAIDIEARDVRRGGAKKPEPGPDPEEWIAAARRISGDDPCVSAIADRLSERLSLMPRGIVDAPFKKARNTVPPRSYHYYDIAFREREPARAQITYSGSSVMLRVYDARSGKLLVSDGDNSGMGDVCWKPNRTGVYRIVVQNNGSEPSRYNLVCY